MTLSPESARVEPLLIRSLTGLIRFRLVSDKEGMQLIIAARSRAERGEKASSGQAEGVRWLAFKLGDQGAKPTLTAEAWVEEQDFEDFDLCVQGDECAWVVEVNGLAGALILSEAPWKGAAASVAPNFDDAFVGIDIPTPRLPRVKKERPWHAQLMPQKWLFNPRVSKGQGGKWLIICNAVDGHLLELRGPNPAPAPAPDPLLLLDKSLRWDEVRFLPDRLFPVATRPDRKVTAFLQAPLNGNLYWSLRRYGGKDPVGNLMIEGDGVPLSNLSALCGVDSVRFRHGYPGWETRCHCGRPSQGWTDSAHGAPVLRWSEDVEQVDFPPPRGGGG